MDRTTDLAKLTADRVIKRWTERQVERRLATAQQLQSGGFYLGYDADQERHRIRLLNGRVVLAESLTTAGQAAGDPVAVSRSGGWRFKTTPRS